MLHDLRTGELEDPLDRLAGRLWPRLAEERVPRDLEGPQLDEVDQQVGLLREVVEERGLADPDDAAQVAHLQVVQALAIELLDRGLQQLHARDRELAGAERDVLEFRHGSNLRADSKIVSSAGSCKGKNMVDPKNRVRANHEGTTRGAVVRLARGRDPPNR